MSPLTSKVKCPQAWLKPRSELNQKGDTLIFKQFLVSLTSKQKCPLAPLRLFYYYLKEQIWLNQQNYI
ncbi:MAG: hypothetical protein ABIL74_05830, partial [candidate division WOR-3 bacterium]